MINQYEPIIYPLYYGWFFAGSPSCNNQDKASPSKMTEKVINDYYNIFLSMLGVPYVHDALALICGFNTGKFILLTPLITACKIRRR